jgi:hypothetical protein
VGQQNKGTLGCLFLFTLGREVYPDLEFLRTQ